MRSDIFELNGRVTGVSTLVKNKIARALPSNYWSSTENSNNNSWNINFSNGSFNNNNKNNNNQVRGVVALSEKVLEEWVDAYLDCCRNKKSSPQCIEYRIRYEDDLYSLAREVLERRYKPTTSFCFVVIRPRYREVFAAAFRDRIVQHWVCMRLLPAFEARFRAQGDVSFNCRKGYGSMVAVDRLEDAIVRQSENYTRDTWIGKFDLRAFFMSVDRQLLLELLVPFIKDTCQGEDMDTLLYLVEVIVRHRPHEDCDKRSPSALWDRLPPSKSLFHAKPDVGMPIGNFTSQQFANFYLSFLDDFILGLCRFYEVEYVRFVDDFVLVGEKEAIQTIVYNVKNYLKSRLHLDLHDDKVYLQYVTKGVKFVGQVIRPGRRYTSNVTIGGLVDKLRVTDMICRRIDREGRSVELLYALDRNVASLNSYMGFLVHTNSYTVRRNRFTRSPWFWCCCFIKGKFRVVKLKKRYIYRFYLLKKEKNEYSYKTDRKRSSRNGDRDRIIIGKKSSGHQFRRGRKRRR